MFEVSYTVARLARIVAGDIESAKRRFAAYALYDDVTNVVSDVELSFGDDAEVAAYVGRPPTQHDLGDELRDWIKRREARVERFEAGLYEDRDRSLDAYLRLLATNDPWRLEGHGSHGRTLSAVPVIADLVTYDARIRYRFEATQFVDYLRADVALAIDPHQPKESISVAGLVDVAALGDDRLRQIASSYEAIVRELALCGSLSQAAPPKRPFEVTFDRDAWHAYVDRRRSEPQRFLPPAGWTIERR